ncbi:hypothetical protein [uncultured Phascolarctobacterium sp.]|uniref:hypothetical protein n=1 Tax=uncultured Phascolarctobacterium sp. TaxID=512296 RepID=UPI00260691C9|nr:hypothetical protein [uncultured Phascolarctobacterium sp.]
MSFNLENGENREINETPEVKVDSEHLSETEETAENFDDCSLNEVQDSKGNEVNAESLEEAEENYDDCEVKMEEMEEENPELVEEDDDDFNDCGKETDGQYVSEVTYTTDGEISQEEASAELQEAYNECNDPEDMQQLKENANENEHIEVHNAEVVERPEGDEVADEVTEEEYEQAQEELEEAEETLEAQQEAAQDYKNDLENQINENENEVPKGTENINNEASEDVEENPEELSETEEGTNEGDESESDEISEDDAEQLEDTAEAESSEAEENAEEVESDGEQVEEQSENIEETAETSDENDEDVNEGTSSETEESTEDVEADDLEQMDDDTKVETSQINDESVSEDVSQKVEEQTETELSDETKEEIQEDVAENINDESEDGKISSEKAEKFVAENIEENVDNIEEQQDSADETIDARADEIVENGDLTDDEAKEQIADEVKESTSENLSDEEVEIIAEEKSDEIEDAVEEKKEEQKSVEAIEETAEELESDQIEQNSEAESKSLQERIDGAFEKDDVSSSEINDLREENATELQAKIEEKAATEAELKSKFDEVLSKEKGSEEYKQSLREYNDLQDQKANLDEQIASMEKQQELLDKKSLELRDAQIQKGAEAVAASAATLAGVNALQERYDQTYYDTKPDNGELANIREESCSTIKELSAEKDSIKQAMDAKMDEISKYVTSNNMDRYDTAHDLRYQQLSAEYNAMKESYDRIGYSIVKLDENNKAITEQLGDEYVSMAELPSATRISEVNDGTDVPGETNYFIDEAKAAEVLSPFKQGNWEQLSIKEQKQAVEKLADYNAEILGVEDKPRIVYYKAEDPCDFGGYSAKQNAIYINEYNMHDAAETADTISHEYRHKYQHERADKLETERDLEFKEGFDNYIRAEDDYQGYKEQLVESDARDYAQAVKEKIASCSEMPNEIKTSFTEQGGQGAVFSKLNPEKGAVFEKISVDELPEDFEQKDRIAYKEVLETQELDELRSVAGVHYENGEAVWSKLGIKELESYKEHNDIENGHIEKVRLKSLEAADTLEAHFSQNDYDGLYSPNIDRRTVEVMSIYHDTGMDGNIKAEDYEAEREAYISNEQIREKYVSDAVSKKEKEAAKTGEPFDRAAAEAKANEKFEKEGFENHFRPNHSLESAIHALRDRESISNLSVNADEVALGCLVHSKSNSGLRNIASEDDWRTAVGRLQERVNEYNESHPDEQIHFDSSFLVNEDGSFNQEKLAEMRSEAIVLRIGDANGHDTNSRTSQTGKSIEFNLEQKAVSDELPSDFESKFEKGEYDEFFLEVQSADVKVGGTELNNTNDPKGISRMFAVGEGNFQSLNCEVDENGVIKQNFELCDGNAFPLSTQHCIEERLDEYKTAHPMKYTPVVKLGSNCSDEVYQSYLAFADKIERDYNVRMEWR